LAGFVNAAVELLSANPFGELRAIGESTNQAASADDRSPLE
jgi:hypothetical protein